MYTQCPDCKTAFRVTAEVLKQAAGQVRCGGCGHAFNALEYLSEQKPSTEAPKPTEPSLPELKPEPDDRLPKSISAEQSAALLKTLDELAGSNIRIEDTGVEWRVLDDEDDGDQDIVDVFDTRESAVDEILEESPTPVDQFLTATPNEVEAAEIFEESANGPAKTPVDELRFDDNTPLPDDFDFDEAPSAPIVEEPGPPVEEPEPQVDLDLSEPDEWEDILDEFDSLGDAPAAPLDAELAALEDDTPPPVEPPVSDEEQELLDMDTQFALQAEAMGIDLSGVHEQAGVDNPVDDAVLDKELAAEATPVEETAEEPIEEPEVAEDATQLELIDGEARERAAAVDEETFGSVTRELASLEDQSDVFDSEFFKAADQVAAELEDEAPDLEIAEPEAELPVSGIEAGDAIELAEETPDLEAEEGIELEDEVPDLQVDELSEPVEEIELEAEFELDAGIDLEEQPDLREELPLAAEPYPEEELGIAPEASPADASDAAPAEPVVAEMTEEEQTINKMIDQDLLSIAVEDEDGFASTIVIPGEGTKGKKPKKKEEKKRKKRKKRKKDEIAEVEQFGGGAGFETIIMEGEHVRSEADYEKLEADAAEAAKLVAAAKAEEAAQSAASRGRRPRLVAGIVGLVLLLAVQALHQSREALATIPVFNKVVGPVYRAIGRPLSPAWDITGWRIEATKGSIEETDETLVVYSRIGNNSDSPLPYPIINISLTDRFEETLGSRQLDPAEYLPDGLDPSELVQPGDNFNAVISIQSPSPEASGYELDVCYRGSSDQLRCAIADFK